MSSSKIISASPRDTENIARNLAVGFKPQMLIALIGNLGSGKTVFVKGLAKGLGCRKKDVLSPTFVLMRQHKGRFTLNHFDLYRLTDISQLQQIGYEEYFWGEGITVIEWADRIKEALPRHHLRIEFKILDKNRRSLKFIPKGREYEDYLRQFKRPAIKIP